MRVGMFTYGMDGERMTGIARYAVELTRAMRGFDDAPEIVLLNPQPEARHPWYGEFRCYPLPRLRLLPMVVTLGLWQLHRAALELSLDILHDPCGIAPFLPGAKYRKVTTIHDAIPFVFPETQPLLTRTVFHTLVRAARYTADGIVTVSEASASDLSRLAGIPRRMMEVTPLGVSRPPAIGARAIADTLARLGVPTPYFLYIGALHPRKNLGRLLEAFSRLRVRHGRANLAVVGPSSWGANDVLRQVLDHEASRAGVIFTGFVSDGDLAILYRGARALVFPSLYEGFGLPVLEAMAHGTPVITSDASSLPEVAGDAALLVDPSASESIEKAMERILCDDDLHAELAERGRARAEQFDWRTTARSTLDLYHRLLDRSPDPGVGTGT